ncbi:MAG: ABC transporter substrate-binding protein [Planctomycetes bacterium]|jgi:NitT/TauT family transport system substrate-binding protein|nr:ABC transporter substrate-binding protein [Planctomycetota bacterium]
MLPNPLRRLCTALATALAFCGGLVAQTYRLSMDPWIAWTPAVIAQEKGFWRQGGMNVVVTSHAGGDAVAEFVAGKAELALMMAGTAVGLQVSGQADLVVLAEVDWSHGGDKMLIKKGRKLADLKQKRIGIYEDSPAVMMFLAAKLATEGLTPADFQVVVIEDMESLANQFTTGRLACAISYEPFVAQATANGNCEVIATTADFPGVMPEVLVAHRRVIQTMPPEHASALMLGWIEAVEWIAQARNQKEFTRISLLRAFAGEQISPAEFAAMLKNVRIHGREELRARNLEADGLPKFLRDCAVFAGSKGEAAERAKAEHMLDTRALKQALSARTKPAAAPAK